MASMEYSKFFRTHQCILVVDDDAAIVDFLTYALTVQGYDVLSANTGPAALAVMETRTPHLVISDYMMPEMTGAQLAMEMRATRRTSSIPIILCTGAHFEQADDQAGLFAEILMKPCPLPTLLSHVQRLMPSLIPTPSETDPSALFAKIARQAK